MNNDKHFEDMMTLTGYPEWKQLADELKKEVYQTQANTLQSAESWDQVCFAKGWSAGLAYIINLRENTLKAEKNAKEQALLDAVV